MRRGPLPARTELAQRDQRWPGPRPADALHTFPPHSPHCPPPQPPPQRRHRRQHRLVVLPEAGDPLRLQHHERPGVALGDRAVEQPQLVHAGSLAQLEGDAHLGRGAGEHLAPAQQIGGAQGGAGLAARRHEVVEHVEAVGAEAVREGLEDAVAAVLALEGDGEVARGEGEVGGAEGGRVVGGELEEGRLAAGPVADAEGAEEEGALRGDGLGLGGGARHGGGERGRMVRSRGGAGGCSTEGGEGGTAVIRAIGRGGRRRGRGGSDAGRGRRC